MQPPAARRGGSWWYMVCTHKSGAAEAGDVAENQALKLSAVDDDIMIEFQAFSVISAVVPTTTGKNNSRGNNL